MIFKNKIPGGEKMKKILTLAILLLIALPLVTAKQSRQQNEMDEDVENVIQNYRDYEKIIESGNKIEAVCDLIGIDYYEGSSKTMSRVFRAIYHSDGFLEYLNYHSGVHFYGSKRGGAAPVAASICGNGVLEVGEQCDDGNTDPLDGCDALCGIE